MVEPKFGVAGLWVLALFFARSNVHGRRGDLTITITAGGGGGGAGGEKIFF